MSMAEADSPVSNAIKADSADPLWAAYLKEHEEEDRALVESWREDMDGLLIFAGLYSATLTAFIIESYKQLKQDSGDVTMNLLAQISQQLSNPSLPIVQSAEKIPFVATRSSIAVNVLWFLSLLLSLACALGATMVKQWARDYAQKLLRPGPAERRGKVRALLRQGVNRWHLESLVDGLPTLLHAALALFFAGLLVFLVDIDRTVFATMLTAVCALAPIYAFFTFAPLRHGDCPFRTPLTMFIVKTFSWLALCAIQATSGYASAQLSSDNIYRRAKREARMIRWAVLWKPENNHIFATSFSAFVGRNQWRRGDHILPNADLQHNQSQFAEMLRLAYSQNDRLALLWANMPSLFELCDFYIGAHISRGSTDGEAAIIIGEGASAASHQHCIRILGSLVSSRNGHYETGALRETCLLLKSGREPQDSVLANCQDAVDGIPSWHIGREHLKNALDAVIASSQHSGDADEHVVDMLIQRLDDALGFLSPGRCRQHLLKYHFVWLFSGNAKKQDLPKLARTARYLLEPSVTVLRAGDGALREADTIVSWLWSAEARSAVLETLQDILTSALSTDPTIFDGLDMRCLFVPAESILSGRFYREGSDQLPCLLVRETCTDTVFAELVRFSRDHPHRPFAAEAVQRAVTLWNKGAKLEELTRLSQTDRPGTPTGAPVLFPDSGRVTSSLDFCVVTADDQDAVHLNTSTITDGHSAIDVLARQHERGAEISGEGTTPADTEASGAHG